MKKRNSLIINYFIRNSIVVQTKKYIFKSTIIDNVEAFDLLDQQKQEMLHNQIEQRCRLLREVRELTNACEACMLQAD